MIEIKVITEPSVYLVGKSTHCTEIDRFLADNGVSNWRSDAQSSGEFLVESAGRLCYMSFKNPRPGGNKSYIDNILESGHGSVLEHVTFSFIITGVCRSLTHQWIRHRAGWAYSEMSQRFCDLSHVEFVCPPEVCPGYKLYSGPPKDYTPEETIDLELVREWLDSCDNAAFEYRRILGILDKKFSRIEDKTERRKRAREAARSALPECAETKIFATANVRALRHFVELRGSLHADAEIRRVALVILKALKDEAPNLFSDFSIEVAEDGREYAKCLYHKV